MGRTKGSKTGQRRFVSIICRRCEKLFNVKPSRAKTAKYCSKECFFAARRWSEAELDYLKKHYRMGQAKHIARHLGRGIPAVRLRAEEIGLSAYLERARLICPVCDNEFTEKPSHADERKYCSWDCYLVAHKAKPKPPLVPKPRAVVQLKYCLWCGKILKPRKTEKSSTFNKRRTCSYSCARKVAWNGKRSPLHTFICQMCNKEFQVRECELKHRPAKYCSTPCQIRGLKGYQSDTKIERLLQQGLMEIGLGHFKKQYYIPGICIADLAFPRLKLCIEADGDYWHSKPSVTEKDRRHNLELAKQGWVVLRFSGTEIRENIDSCLVSIQDTFSQLHGTDSLPNISDRAKQGRPKPGIPVKS